MHSFFAAATHLMCALARARGHSRLRDLSLEDLTTWKRDVAYLTGVAYGGVVPL